MERDICDAEQFACPICAKVFKTTANLRVHRRIHVGVKKYRCEQCDMRFHQKVNLKHHLNVHSNEQPYHCDLCAKGFNQPSNLRVHREICAQKQAISQFDVIKVAPIQTEAMTDAMKGNRIPFVGVFFADGSAKLYRAYIRDEYCLLRPINSDDLRKTKQHCGDGTNITISTVASVQQRVCHDEYGERTVNEFVFVDSDGHHEFIAKE